LLRLGLLSVGGEHLEILRPHLLAVGQLRLSAQVLIYMVDLLGPREHHLYFDCDLLLGGPVVEVDVARPVALRET